MLNSNEGNSLSSEQYNWLLNELKSKTEKWTVVAMHCPIYGVGQWGADPDKNGQSLGLRNQLQGIFATYGVDIVLQGHDHTVSRTYPINGDGKEQTETMEKKNGVDYSVNPKGVIYVADGTSGGQTGKPYHVNDSNKHLYKYTGKSQRSSWAEFAISGNELLVTVKNYDGSNVNVTHTWGIKKSA